MAIVYPSYLNTLLFSIVSLALCVGLMLLILAREVSSLFPMMLVVDAGILVVVLMALANIVNNQAAARTTSSSETNDKKLLDKKNTVIVRNCPDYFEYSYSVTDPTTQKHTITCKNKITLYSAVTGAAITYTLKAIKKAAGGANSCFTPLPSSINLDDMAVVTNSSGARVPNPNGGATDESICKYVNSLPDVPWTFIRPVC